MSILSIQLMILWHMFVCLEMENRVLRQRNSRVCISLNVIIGDVKFVFFPCIYVRFEIFEIWLRAALQSVQYVGSLTKH